MNTLYALATDSACDMPISYLSRREIAVIPLQYTIDNVTYPDDGGISMSYAEFYSRVRAGASSVTSMVNTQSYTVFFEQFLKEKKDVVYIAFSSGLSGSYSSAVMAAEELSAAYENKVHIVDSLGASMGFGLMVHEVADMRDAGLTAQQLALWAENNKQSYNHLFTIDNLMHIFRGGRLSRTSAIMGTLVGIKPILMVDQLGKLVAIDKCRGRGAALIRLVDKMEEHGKEFGDVFISHCDALKDAKTVESEIMKRLSVKSVMINDIGPVIGTHSGAGTVALFFKGRRRDV